MKLDFAYSRSARWCSIGKQTFRFADGRFRCGSINLGKLMFMLLN